MPLKRIAGLVCLLISLLCGIGSAQAQTAVSSEAQLAKQMATAYVNNLLPAQLGLYRLQNQGNDGQSLALRYDWNSDKDWVDDSGTNGTDFSGTSSSLFAHGNYVFSNETVNPSELSEIGAKWSRRWFPITVSNPLNKEQALKVQQCMSDPSSDFSVTVEDCRRKLGYGETRMKYWYVDVGAHVKVEGDQEFDQRHYAYGLEANFSRSFGAQTLFVNPILTFGVDQVDPKGDKARLTVSENEKIFTRLYGKVGFTSNLFQIDGHTIKLNYSLRYFREINSETAIKTAGLDTFHYSAIAVQIPALLLPGFDNANNSFIFSYSYGELPFNLRSEKTFEIGFRHNIDLSGFF
jgi:hypothetical protein